VRGCRLRSPRDLGLTVRAVTFDDLPAAVRELAAQRGTNGVLLARGRAVLYGPGWPFKSKAAALAELPDANATWARSVAPRADSRVSHALGLLERGEAKNPADAAKKVGVHHSAVYMAVKARLAKGLCPCCRRPLPTND